MPNIEHRRRDSLSFRLGAMLILAVLVFDFCSVLAPDLAGRPLVAGGTVTLGILFAFLIMIAVVATAVYYVCWLKHEDPASQSVTGARPD
jgi:uncharacterized membrane protein (DUF485 family)